MKADHSDLRNLGLASLGATLEYYDFIVYVYVAGALSHAFFPPAASPWIAQIQVLAIYAIGYFVRPVAGIVLAHFADRIGRKRLFLFTVLLMSVPTFLIGLLPTYAQVGWAAPLALLALRILQGCAVGGELPSAAVFVSEHARPGRLFLSSGVLHGIVHCGLLLGAGAAAMAAAVGAAHPQQGDLAWRLPFLLGGAFGLFASYLRRRLQETPLFEKIRLGQEARVAFPLRSVLARYAPACAVGFSIMLIMSITNALFFQYLPTYLTSLYALPARTVLTSTLVGTAALALSMPAWGWLADRWGPAWIIGLGGALCAATDLAYFHVLPSVLASPFLLTLALIPVALAGGAVISIVPGFIASLFPTAIRQSGYAVPYNISAAVFAGPAPLVLAWLTRSSGPQGPMYAFLVPCLVAVLAAAFIGRIPRFLGARPTAGLAPFPSDLIADDKGIR